MRTKIAFEVTQKAFFIIFKNLTTRNCLRPESAPLILIQNDPILKLNIQKEIALPNNSISWKNWEQGQTNFFLGTQLLGHAILLAHPIGHTKNGCSKPKCTQLETLLFVLYNLNRTCSFHFKCASIKHFCSDAFVVWMLFKSPKYGVTQRIILILQTHPSKSLQKNLLKAWNFTENKICHRCFDNNLQKPFRTKILKNSNRETLLIVALMVGLLLKLQMEIVD